MLGERYFAMRGKLAQVMRGIADLAVETGTDPGAHLPLAEMAASLGSPFLFVVCGEVNAGKSTLINGLCGHDLCRVNILPETNRVLLYRFGNPAHDVAVAPLLEERCRPLGFLRDFQLVDTPGTNSVIQGHQAVTERFLNAADLVLFVYPIANPWGAATWNALSGLSPGVLARVVLIIQQADLRESKDIAVILGHMADLSMKRIGQVPPIFAISGKLACEAKRTDPINADLLQASGYPALEEFISHHICQSFARLEILESCRSRAAAALRAVDERIEEQTRSINSQSRFIENVEAEIIGIRQQFVTRLPRHLAQVAEAFESEGLHVTKLLRRRLNAFPSIIHAFTGTRTGPEMEAVFIERLQFAVDAVAQKDGAEVADACHAHWLKLGQRVQSAFGVDLNAAHPIDTTLLAARTHFVQRLGCAARQGIGNLKVRNPLDKDLRRRNHSLQSFIFMTLVLTIAGATCGALGVPWAPWILTGLAVLFLTFGVTAAWATRNAITRDFQRRLLDTCGVFASTLHTDFEEALRLVFQDYAAALGDIHTHIACEKLAVEPRLRVWQELFHTLKTLEQEL
jgi:GTPase SAR1 family protein